MGWLTSYTKSCCDEINDASTTLDHLKDNGVYYNDTYYQDALNLVGNQFSGVGATAFLQEVNTDINSHRIVLDGVGHVSSDLATLSNTISNSSNNYDTTLTSIQCPWSETFDGIEDFDIWRDNLINDTLNYSISYYQVSLNLVLVSGSAALIDAYASAKKSAEATSQRFADNYIAAIEADPNDPEYFGFKNHGMDKLYRQYCDSSLSYLEGQVWTNLSDWADELAGAQITFSLAVPQAESYLSARDLYDYIYTSTDHTQSTNKPITITPYTTNEGQKGLLITLGGLDMGNNEGHTGVQDAIFTGIGNDEPYEGDLKAAIAQYMQEHPEMRGAQVTFAGYSQGGMTAENLLDYDYPNQNGVLKHNDLKPTTIITYGSPAMGEMPQGINYTDYWATYDPVPKTSSWSIIHHDAQQPNMTRVEITDVENEPSPTPVINDHLHYYQSAQLNGPDTAAGIDINPTSLGPTEYFGQSK